MSTFDVRDMMKMDSGPGTYGPAPSGTVSTDSPRPLNPLAERIAAMPTSRSMSAIMIEGVTRFADAAIIAITGFAVFQFYLSGMVDYHLPYWIIVSAVLVSAQIVFQALHIYQLGALRSFTAQFFRVVAGWSMMFLLGLALLFFMKSGDLISRVWFGGYFLAGLAALLKYPERFAGKKVGLVLCGGNIDPLLLASIIERGMVRAGRLARITVSVRDVPGALAKITATVAEAGANIDEVHHQRAFTLLAAQNVEIELVIQTRGKEHIQQVLAALGTAGFDAVEQH